MKIISFQIFAVIYLQCWLYAQGAHLRDDYGNYNIRSQIYQKGHRQYGWDDFHTLDEVKKLTPYSVSNANDFVEIIDVPYKIYERSKMHEKSFTSSDVRELISSVRDLIAIIRAMFDEHNIFKITRPQSLRRTKTEDASAYEINRKLIHTNPSPQNPESITLDSTDTNIEQGSKSGDITLESDASTTPNSTDVTSAPSKANKKASPKKKSFSTALTEKLKNVIQSFKDAAKEFSPLKLLSHIEDVVKNLMHKIKQKFHKGDQKKSTDNRLLEQVLDDDHEGSTQQN